MGKKALMTASVASMIDLFNRDNIHILQELGYEVHVAANFKEGSITSDERVKKFRKELENEGITTFHVPIPRSLFKVWSILSSCFQMKKICKKGEYDLIHTQSPIGGVVARLAAAPMRKRGTHVIYTAHGFHFYKGAPLKNWLIFYPIERFFARFTDVLITINQEDYQRAKKFPVKQVCYIHGIGINTQNIAMDMTNRIMLRKELGIAENDFVVLSVGQLSRRKNHGAVIHAMAQIPDVSVKYLLVGLGEKETEYQALIEKLGLQGRVIMAGYRNDISNMLAISDCFAFPSLQEGLPVSLMEAMAAGLPIVCSDIRGNHDLIQDGVNGRLVALTDEERYAGVILEYRMNPWLANRYAEEAKQKVMNFDKKIVKEEMKKIYSFEMNADSWHLQKPK